MLLYKPIKISGIYLFFILPMFLLSCVFKSKEENKIKNNAKSELEQKQIAQLLVQLTEANFELFKFLEISKTQTVSEDVRLYFSELEKATINFQNNIASISEKKLVTIPIYNKPNSVEISEENLLKNIMNQLISEAVHLEKIKSGINDKSILELKNNYLPLLNSNLEKISTLRIKKYNNN